MLIYWLGGETSSIVYREGTSIHLLSWRTPPIPPTVSSSSYPQEDGTGVSDPAPPDCSTAFSPRLWEPWTHITLPLSETPNKPLPPETWTIIVYRFILFYFVLYICIHVAPWSCKARHLVPLYVHTCSGMTIKLNLTRLETQQHPQLRQYVIGQETQWDGSKSRV